MDFSSLSAIDTREKAEAGVDVPFNRLDGTPLLTADGKPVGVTLRGSDSSAVRRFAREMGRRRVERMQKQRGRALSDEQMDKDNQDEIEFLAKACVGWFGIIDSKGKEVPFTTEAAVQMFTSHPVAKEQAEAAINDRTRFI